jgi:hypothetical protein
VLRITSKVKADEALVTSFYNISDLLTEPSDPLDESDLDYDNLIEVITSTVEPASWAEVGGRGTITPFRGLLVVSQVAEHQQSIVDLLARLRMVRQKQKAPAVAAADPNALELRGYALAELQVALSWGAPAQTEGETSAPASPVRDEELTKALLKLVQDSVEPKSWQSAGGKGQVYAIRNASGGAILLVRQTAAVHRQVRRFMRNLTQEVERVQARVSGGEG